VEQQTPNKDQILCLLLRTQFVVDPEMSPEMDPRGDEVVGGESCHCPVAPPTTSTAISL